MKLGVISDIFNIYLDIFINIFKDNWNLSIKFC